MLNFSAALSCYWSLFDHLGGGNDGLKDLTDPPSFSPETRATEVLKTSPETTERMASLPESDAASACNFGQDLLEITFHPYFRTPMCTLSQLRSTKLLLFLPLGENRRKSSKIVCSPRKNTNGSTVPDVTFILVHRGKLTLYYMYFYLLVAGYLPKSFFEVLNELCQKALNRVVCETVTKDFLTMSRSSF